MGVYSDGRLHIPPGWQYRAKGPARISIHSGPCK